MSERALMDQNRLGSLIEACFNTAIGFVVALVSQLAVFPLFDIHIPLSSNLGIGAFFTVISVVRGYLLRRFFNALLREAAQRLARKAST